MQYDINKFGFIVQRYDGDGTISQAREFITVRFNSLVVPPFAERYCVHDLEHKYIDGTDMEVYPLGCVTLPEKLVTCLLVEDLDDFMKMDYAVQLYGENSKDPFLPCETELCVAKVHDVWCRCIFIQLLGTTKKALVYNLDYGVISSIDVDDIRVNEEKRLL